jgi:RNA-binding protein
MESKELTGAEKSRLRGIGQRLDASFKVGKDGLTDPVLRELRRQLASRGLVKIRHLGADRDARAELNGEIAAATGSLLVGAVGQTALFFSGDAGKPLPGAPKAGPASTGVRH